VFSEKDPKYPVGGCKADIVAGASGIFRTKAASIHLSKTVKKVVITAPAKGEVDFTTVLGPIKSYDNEKHHIISNASCTTNASR
jgi:glyceraldehyde 3-phosphate dehydrogenase